MKAVGLYKSLPIDHPEALLDVDVPKPTPGERDLLVAIKAIAVNPVDYKVRSRSVTEATLRILGWDATGIVDAVGPRVTLFKPGDSVYYAGDITRPGCNAEYHVVDERITGRKPKSLDFPQAAALPLTTITAYEALFDVSASTWRVGIVDGPWWSWAEREESARSVFNSPSWRGSP